MNIRVLSPADAARFQALRLQGLREQPAAFASSAEEEVDASLEEVARRLVATSDGAVFGAFDDAMLLGIVGLQRESKNKLAHKAWIWGMYVAPLVRRQGIGRRLLQQALAHASREFGVRQVNLGVNSANQAALALYQSLGFTSYGVERGFLLVDGVLHDEHQMVNIVDGAVAWSRLAQAES
jgi:RimJ/RimL family protein N-acetyltransferase